MAFSDHKTGGRGSGMMMPARTAAMCALGMVFLQHGVRGQDLARYRDFELTSALAAVSALTGVASSAVRLIHQRPAVLQNLEWRPSRWSMESAATSTDAVEQILFSFLDDRLFRMVVDYGYDRTEGMTDADVIEAISDVYGTPAARTGGGVSVASPAEPASGVPVARWGDAQHAVVLYRRSGYRETFRLIVSEPVLESLARAAAIQAVQLDQQEAPAREIARQQKAEDDGRAAAERARLVNKEAFRP